MLGDIRGATAEVRDSSRMAIVLEIEDLTTRFATPDGEVAAVSEVSFAVGDGESLGVVGECGSGKTQLFLSVMGLLARNGAAPAVPAFAAASC